MVYGVGGKFGIVCNVESATCRSFEAVVGSNPTLTARISSSESITYSIILKSSYKFVPRSGRIAASTGRAVPGRNRSTTGPTGAAPCQIHVEDKCGDRFLRTQPR